MIASDTVDVLGGYFEFFFGTLGGTTMAPLEFRAKALALSAREGE